MAPNSVATWVESLRQSLVLESAQFDEVLSRLQHRFPERKALARELVQRSWLTSFQANYLLQGRGSDLAWGPYTLLDSLGEGGSGLVFKARHRAMNRVVALKVIRKEWLTDPEIVGRFCREIELISQLSHPHIVHAYDAGPLGARHVLVMEYIEGVSLERMVKEAGPLPVQQACEYIRQAALGLQHAHERGLIHRDVKPSNLLVTKAGVVKILDLGLARLRQPLSPGQTDLTLLAGQSVTQGTPDYLAPEQALDFHAADIRADIYSLGCTFYQLLAGRPPFAGGSLAEKLMRHQQTEPRPVESERPDLPAEISTLLRKMLAKRPADRCQSPAEVAKSLAAILGASARPVAAGGAARSDGELLALFVATGQGVPFEVLVRRYHALVFHVCLRVLRHSHDAEDAAQAVFLALAHKARSLQHQPSVAGWLHHVARDVSRNALKSAQRRQRREQVVQEMKNTSAPHDRSKEELATQLDQAIGTLPEKYRLPLILHHLQQQTENEVARQLGCTTGAISMRLTRAREMLRGRLARGGTFLSGGVLLSLLGESAGAATPLAPAFLSSTVTAATLIAAGNPAVAGVVSAQAAMLMKGALKTMFFAKLKIAAALTLTAGLVLGATGLGFHQALADKPPAAKKADDGNLSLAEFEKLHKELHIKTQPWTRIPWQVSLTEARQLAAKEKKPLFIVSGNGHLLDCG